MHHKQQVLILQDSFLKSVITESPSIQIVPIEQCQGVEHLEQSLQQVQTKRGEGIMLYHPNSPYLPGRTRNLLKAKIYFHDQVQFLGRSNNSISFICQQNDGTECIVKCDRGAYTKPPQVGQVLMVRHSGIAKRSKKLKRPFLHVDHRQPLFDQLTEENVALKE